MQFITRDSGTERDRIRGAKISAVSSGQDLHASWNTTAASASPESPANPISRTLLAMKLNFPDKAARPILAKPHRGLLSAKFF
jgi:hypothetical protein